jgi:hypothetical protein
VSIDRARSTTYIAIAHPERGTWKIRTLPGSSAIARVLEANPAPKPKVAGKISLSGCTEKLSYSYRPVAGDQIGLDAQNGSKRTFFGHARAGRHVLRFVPALTGAGQVIANFVEHGVPSAQTVLVAFNPAKYRQAATPRRLRVRGSVLSWTPACNATGYSITTAYGQTTTTTTTRASHLKLPTIRGSYTVTINASITGGGMTSATAHFR